MTSIAIGSKFDNTTSDGEKINSSGSATGGDVLPHAIDNLFAFLERVRCLEASLDGPVSKPRGRSALDR